MKTYKLLICFLLIAPALPAQQKCDSLYVAVSTDTFKRMLEKKDGILLDVRTPEEWKTGYIKNAVNIDYRSADFKDKIAMLDKTQTYYVYCEIGGRSAMAAEYMKAAGFCRVIALRRGLRVWKEMDYPVVIPAE